MRVQSFETQTLYFSKKKLKKMCKSLKAKNGSKVLIGFGDWSNNDSGGILKKNQVGPVNKFKLMLKKDPMCKVVPIDEFRTSKLHNKCGLPLTNMCSHSLCEDSVRRNLKVHSVLHCLNNGCYGITMNRDSNASKNILDILVYFLKYKIRHPDFSRSRILPGTKPCTKTPSGSLLYSLSNQVLITTPIVKSTFLTVSHLVRKT